MKRHLMVSMLLACALVLTACGEDTKEPPEKTESVETTPEQPQKEAPSAEYQKNFDQLYQSLSEKGVKVAEDRFQFSTDAEGKKEVLVAEKDEETQQPVIHLVQVKTGSGKEETFDLALFQGEKNNRILYYANAPESTTVDQYVQGDFNPQKLSFNIDYLDGVDKNEAANLLQQGIPDLLKQLDRYLKQSGSGMSLTSFEYGTEAQ